MLISNKQWVRIDKPTRIDKNIRKPTDDALKALCTLQRAGIKKDKQGQTSMLEDPYDHFAKNIHVGC